MHQLTQFMQQHKGMIVNLLKRHYLFTRDFVEIKHQDVFFKGDAEYAIKCAFLRAKRYMNRVKRGRFPNIAWMFLNKEFRGLYKETYHTDNNVYFDDIVDEDDSFSLHNVIASDKPLPDANAKLKGEQQAADSIGDIFAFSSLRPITVNLTGKVSQKTINLISILTSPRLALIRDKREKIGFICEKLRCEQRNLRSILASAYKEIKKSGLMPFRVLCQNGKCEEYIVWAEDIESARDTMSMYGDVIDLQNVA